MGKKDAINRGSQIDKYRKRIGSIVHNIYTKTSLYVFD